VIRPPLSSTLLPYTTLFRSVQLGRAELRANGESRRVGAGESESSGAGDAPKQSGERQSLSGGKKKGLFLALVGAIAVIVAVVLTDRKSTRLNSSHLVISYAV